MKNSNPKKIMTGFAMSMLLSAGLSAQSTSYTANIMAIPGVDNAAFGANVLNVTTTGNYNIGVGRWALVNNTSGYRNIAVGGSVLGNNSTGYSNTGIGYGCLAYNNTGLFNTAVGNEALFSNTAGAYNSALGNGALYDNLTGSGNTAVGHLALNYNTSSSNSALGNSAMRNNTSGHHNTGIGTAALGFNQTGSFNTAIGYNSGINSLTGDSNTFVGSFSNVSLSTLRNASAIGNKALVNNNNRMWLGNSIIDIWGSNSFFIVSDQRFKSSVSSDDVKGLEFIKLLRPVVYNFEAQKLTEFMAKNLPDSLRKIYLDQNFKTQQAIRKSGFLAQEVEAAANKAGYNFSGVHKPENENDTYGVAYAEFVVPLVKAVQEQQQMIEDQAKENTDLKAQMSALQNQVKELLGKTSVSTGINANNPGSAGFVMEQNIPNPFNGETTVKYTLPETVTAAKLVVYDLSGKQIASFPVTEKGSSSITLSSEKLAAGIYIYSIIADGKIVDSKRMVVAEK